MSSRKVLIDALLAAGASANEASALSALEPSAGATWTTEVLNSGKVDERKFALELARLFKAPFETIDEAGIQRAALKLLPSRFVFKHHILPLSSDDARGIRLATCDVFNSIARTLASQELPGRRIEWVITPRGPLLRAIKMLYGVGAETFDEILQTTRTYDGESRDETQDITNDDPEASVVKFVNQIIREAIHERATDIHVEPLENDLRIRYRIDGILHEVAVPPQLRVLQSAIISRLKVMARMDIAERRLPQDGSINLNTSTGLIDVRVSTIPTVNGESISLRLLSRTETSSFGLDRLDMSESQLVAIRKLLQQPNGIVLVTGPTGSGKSTSLYSFLTSINAVSRRIITIEEPLEYRLLGMVRFDPYARSRRFRVCWAREIAGGLHAFSLHWLAARSEGHPRFGIATGLEYRRSSA